LIVATGEGMREVLPGDAIMATDKLEPLVRGKGNQRPVKEIDLYFLPYPFLGRVLTP